MRTPVACGFIDFTDMSPVQIRRPENDAFDMLADIVGAWPMADLYNGKIKDLYRPEKAMNIIGGSLPGQIGTVHFMNFDGVDDYLFCPDSDDLRFTGAFALGGWFYFGSLSGKATGLITKTRIDTNQRSYRLVENDGNIMFQINTNGMASGYHSIISSVPSYVERWTFISAYYRPCQEMAICVNGVWDSAEACIPPTILAGNSDFVIGDIPGMHMSNLAGKASMCWAARNDQGKETISALFERTKNIFGIDETKTL